MGTGTARHGSCKIAISLPGCRMACKRRGLRGRPSQQEALAPSDPQALMPAGDWGRAALRLHSQGCCDWQRSHNRLRAQDLSVQGVAQAHVDLPPAQPLAGHGLQARPKDSNRQRVQGRQRRQRRCGPARALRAALGVRMQLAHPLHGAAQAVAGPCDRCRGRHSMFY